MTTQRTPGSAVGSNRRAFGGAQRALADTAESAIGRAHRNDPALPRTGGPAGNAELTAVIGLLLLVLILAELATLISVGGLITWHIAIGVALIPPALVKTATTGWRIARYYGGSEHYHRGGPPPLLLRILGPIVVATTLAVLGSGLALIPLGPATGRTPLFVLLGQSISPLTIHQGVFILWAVATGLHVLARIVPAGQLAAAATRRGTARLDGGGWRNLALVATVAAAAATAVLVVTLSHSWQSGDLHRFHHGRPPPGVDHAKLFVTRR